MHDTAPFTSVRVGPAPVSTGVRPAGACALPPAHLLACSSNLRGVFLRVACAPPHRVGILPLASGEQEFEHTVSRNPREVRDDHGLMVSRAIPTMSDEKG